MEHNRTAFSAVNYFLFIRQPYILEIRFNYISSNQVINRLPISVVILTCNEAAKIENCILHARLISDDIIVVDSGSVDRTVEIVRNLGCSVMQECWNGYGKNKNKGIKAAKNDWILSLDADEIPDNELIISIRRLDLSNPSIVYNIPFKVFFEKKAIRFGSFGNEKHIRLFNRTAVKWTDVPVHETLLVNKKIMVKWLPGYISHYAINSREEYRRKMVNYAALSANKYLMTGKRATVIKRYFSPGFNFVKNYIFRLGLIDGKEGFFIASTMAWYTWLKYHYLYRLECRQNSGGKHSIRQINQLESTA